MRGTSSPGRIRSVHVSSEVGCVGRVRGGIVGKASAPHRFGGFKHMEHAVALAMLVVAVAATTKLEVDSYR